MVCGRQLQLRFWKEFCLSEVHAMTSWRNANKTVCVACDLGTKMVDETHMHIQTHTYYTFHGTRI
jgi:hypothetical protein